MCRWYVCERLAYVSRSSHMETGKQGEKNLMWLSVGLTEAKKNRPKSFAANCLWGRNRRLTDGGDINYWSSHIDSRIHSFTHSVAPEQPLISFVSVDYQTESISGIDRRQRKKAEIIKKSHNKADFTAPHHTQTPSAPANLEGNSLMSLRCSSCRLFESRLV